MVRIRPHLPVRHNGVPGMVARRNTRGKTSRQLDSCYSQIGDGISTGKFSNRQQFVVIIGNV
jgi:hypothetical protein